ncbi:hypothetical protein VTH06DRAFT_333 [Thermothelomyces fergusii]
MPTTGAIPPANDMSNTKGGGGGSTSTGASSRTAWIGFVVFGICAMALAIVMLMLFLVICLEPLRGAPDAVRTLPCHHLFHAECVGRWFRKHHDTCPICMAHHGSVSVAGSGGGGGGAVLERPPPVFLPF